eukprot:g29652.t2
MHQHASPGLDRDNIAAVLRSGNKEEVLPVLHLLICAGKATIESLQVLEHVGRLLRHQDAEGLIQMLQRVEDVCVRAALSALGKVGPNISPSHKDLVVRHVALCLSGSHRVRSRALRTLGELKAMRQALGIHRFGAKQDPESERAKGGMATRMKIEAQRPEGALQATTDTPRLSKDLKEAQEVIDSLKEAFAASEQRADQQAQLFVQREQHWQNELAQAESLAEVAAQEKDELCAELVEKAKDLKEAQGVIDSLKEALVASEKRADQQAQQFEQREQHWQNEFAHAAAKAESLTEAAAQEKAREVGEDVKTHVEQDSGSPAKEVDLRRRMEAMFKSKLKGSEWLPWQSCIDSLQSYGSWIRVKDFLDILFASPKEKQKLEDFMKMKKPISLCLPLRITFKLRETPSVLSNMADKTFAGRIKPGAKYCYASYPGKFKTGFEALSSDVGEFGDQSVACVYFCKKEDGLGSHHPDPEDSKGRCYCRRIYGEGNDSNRDYQTFGYIHWIGAPYGEKMANAQKVAEAMNAVLVREDASEEEKTHAIREAKRRWNQSGRVAAWGCLWLHVWFGHMKEAVKRRQRLKVVYYPGMALCSAVLSGHLESAIQDRDDFGRLSAGVHIEKTEFVKAYKHVLMSSIDLTPHQEEKKWLKSVPDLSCVRTKGTKASTSRFNSLTLAHSKLDHEWSALAFLLSVVCISHGWAAKPADLWAPDKKVAISTAGPVAAGKQKAKEDAKKDMQEERRTAANTFHVMTKFICVQDNKDTARMVYLILRPEALRCSKMLKELRSDDMTLSYFSKWAHWWWMDTATEHLKCMSDLAGLQRVGFNMDVLHVAKTEESEVAWQDSLAGQMGRMLLHLLRVRAGSQLFHTNGFGATAGLVHLEDSCRAGSLKFFQAMYETVKAIHESGTLLAKTVLVAHFSQTPVMKYILQGLSSSMFKVVPDFLAEELRYIWLTEEEVVQKICFRSQVEKNTPDIDDPELEQVVRDTLLVGEQDQALTRRRGNLTAKTLRPKVRQMYQVAAKGVKAWSDKANVEARKAKEKKEV